MPGAWSIIVLTIVLSVPVFGQDCGDVPELNRKIVQLARGKIKKKVGRGECWDLANYVLTETGAEWDQLYEYGRLIDPKKECILPGDIIQFKGVKLKWKSGNATYTESMMHHTAIVTEVVNKNELRIAHQNTAQFGKKVGEAPFFFDRVISGKMKIYRPVMP